MRISLGTSTLASSKESKYYVYSTIIEQSLSILEALSLLPRTTKKKIPCWRCSSVVEHLPACMRALHYKNINK
jgi:5'-deoxynucleotidase YfbR-like HD superfamily hydrolase